MNKAGRTKKTTKKESHRDDSVVSLPCIIIVLVIGLLFANYSILFANRFMGFVIKCLGCE